MTTDAPIQKESAQINLRFISVFTFIKPSMTVFFRKQKGELELKNLLVNVWKENHGQMIWFRFHSR